ncbi:ribosome maturation factor RimP [Galactobacter caseinivorans]|uniref:Ribosome maturation factor RimP n=1 Tax=Galactobacter caseinivorans TaxID=2676123 RepID=A0A496PJZ2_9MICC|nr:ribosome maturation factor RimP [Galactobacter caseinivorans]RKW70778.1 ribosome maturation factor RimP [Galactobacter caseinivorans]
MPTTQGGPVGTDELTEALSPVVQRAGLVLEAVETAEGDPPVVRVIVDRPDGTEGVNLDVVAELSNAIGEVLDAGLLSGPAAYDLEVTSPGATRAFTEPRHWMRNVGRMVQLKTVDGEELGGLVLDADQDGIRLEPVKPPAKKGMKAKILPVVELSYEQIRRGKVDIEATASRLLADPAAGYADDSIDADSTEEENEEA